MSLGRGTRLGVFEVVDTIGAGGMGEVYRARDTKLGREVALKVLPEHFAADPERLARFEREAQVLASLNHPHIAQIYGAEDSAGMRALVMELVEGPTLADRIARGAIPLDEALPIARQIADALEAAHELGVIHRDLKPANVKVRDDGTVKVLDFGLAKLVESPGAPSNATLSPTITSPALATGVGVLLGTAAYMSPEQAKGRPADKRSDIWAFGCVLYETLAGKRTFDGEDVSETLAAVLKETPDWSRLPRALPPVVRLAIQQCLEKDRARRLADMSALQFAIADRTIATSSGPETVTRAPSRPWALAGVGILTLALTSAAWWSMMPRPSAPVVARFSITIPEKRPFLSQYQSVAVSPDGTQIAYVVNFRLHIRALGDREGRPIAGLEDLSVASPAFSPDGNSIVFYAGVDRTLRKVPVGGRGPVTTLCRIEEDLAGISWGPSGILFGQGVKGIMRVSPDGGTPETVAAVAAGELAYGPQALPGDDALLFTIATGEDIDRWDKARIVTQSLASGRRKTLLEGGSDARYLSSGHIVYAVGGIVHARRFNPRQLEVSREAVPVITGVRRTGASRALGGAGAGLATTQFSVSSGGTLVYVPGPSASSSLLFGGLVRAHRNGTREPLRLPAGPYQLPRVSPDGTRVAFGTDDGKSARLFVYDLSGRENARPLTFEGNSRFPIWSADGEWIVFQSDHEGDAALFRRRADGTSGSSERLTKPGAGEIHAPEAWQPKGDTLLFTVTKDQVASLWMLSLRDRDPVPFPGLERLANWPTAAFSPDGRWVAYAAAQSLPRTNLFVEPFPPTGAKSQLTTSPTPGGSNGYFPVWSPDGKELLYVAPGGSGSTLGLAAVSVTTTRGVEFGNPVPLERGFRIVSPGIGRARQFDIMPDGQHFIGVVEAEEIEDDAGVQRIEVVLNWTEELKRLVAND